MLSFIPTPIAGLVVVHSDPFADDRGAFARIFDDRVFDEAGMRPQVTQVNRSRNQRSGTLRGLHVQVPPHTESKLVMCVRGSIFDVAVDLRHDSPTFGAWHGVHLEEDSWSSLYIPPLFAHGFITTSDDTEVVYFVSGSYSPEHERGFRWDDPSLAIDWPVAVTNLSAKDAAWAEADLERWRAELHELSDDRRLSSP